MMPAYLAAELLLLILAKGLDLAAVPGSLLGAAEFAAIVLNTVVAFACYGKYRWAGRQADARAASRDDLVAWALLATLAGDFFLTLIGTEDVFVPGVLMFCVTQLLYAAYLRPGRASVISRAVLGAAGILVLGLSGRLTAASALGAADLALLSMNVITAWTRARENTPLLFRIGLTLFLLCDFSIALRFVTAGAVRAAAAFLVWVFYAPSQVLITVSYVNSVKTEG